MTARDISSIIDCKSLSVNEPEAAILHLLTDSRRLLDAEGTIFFAIPTSRNSGLRYVAELYDKGVRNFVIPSNADLDIEANLWRVDDVVLALQRLAAYKRGLYNIPVVGITGSNGKTIVKDWIVQLLSPDMNIVSSPKSFNSQIGVPLSVWHMNDKAALGVFEAGISKIGEMQRLRPVINPTVGIFTNIGQAHDENFTSRRQKIDEKLQLFTHCKTLVYCADDSDIATAIEQSEALRQVTRLSWGHSDHCYLQLANVATSGDTSTLHIRCATSCQTESVTIPFVDRASIQNAMHCITLMMHMGYPAATIAERCAHLQPVEMRLQMLEGADGCSIVNDGYSLDLNSLEIALEFVQHEGRNSKKTLIVSDIMQTGMTGNELYGRVAELARGTGVSRIIGIGEEIGRCAAAFTGLDARFYPTTEDFLKAGERFSKEIILLKGARKYRFERVAKALQRHSHETVMEVSMDALVSNLNYYRSLIKPTTKVMGMVKASAYGAGKVEVASALHYNGVDYLTVAYSDEGVELRRAGISLPIMVMNPEEECFEDMIRNKLEPDIYSFRIMDSFAEAVAVYGEEGQRVDIHVEFDTGMHRLGFVGDDIQRLCDTLKREECPLRVVSVFSHLACSDDPEKDYFTHRQINLFKGWSDEFMQRLGRKDICRHILNSSGIARFGEAQMDMVRLGIGLYGYAPEPEVQKHLRPVSRLTSRISQLKDIPAGDSVGYGRRWVAEKPSRIAIIPIGYADGLNRRLGYGHGCMLVAGHEVPIIGSICMDMCFLDVTGIECREGDEVVIFGDTTLMQHLAKAANTISYEILTSVAPRVKRVYTFS